MPIPKITGPQVLRAVRGAAKNLLPGANLVLGISDAEDLYKLTADELVAEFGIDRQLAEKSSVAVLQEDLSELEKLLGVQLIVDQSSRKSLIPNAGIIRSAGAWADNPFVANTPDEIVKQIRQMRNPSRVD